jgi:hypothetical protein
VLSTQTSPGKFRVNIKNYAKTVFFQTFYLIICWNVFVSFGLNSNCYILNIVKLSFLFLLISFHELRKNFMSAFLTKTSSLKYGVCNCVCGTRRPYRVWHFVLFVFLYFLTKTLVSLSVLFGRWYECTWYLLVLLHWFVFVLSHYFDYKTELP